MKVLFFSILLIFPFQLKTMSLKTEWNQSYQKQLVFNCDDAESDCKFFCKDRFECKIIEPFCRDCVGGNILVDHFFKSVGKLFIRSDQEVSHKDFFSYISKNKIITITPKSVFNHITKFNSPILKKKFQKLCKDQFLDYHPVVIFPLDSDSNKLNSPSFVICQSNLSSRIYRITPFGKTFLGNYL